MSNRPAPFKAADVTRAVKGAVAGGLQVREVIATAEGIRLIIDDSQERKPCPNSFDKALEDKTLEDKALEDKVNV